MIEIQKGYVEEAPSPQLMVDLFKGSWSSRIPVDGLISGQADLFRDGRIEWFLSKVHTLDGLKVLELGPLEGGHSYMLGNAGAQVISIEASGNAFLKCLIAKEILGMKNVSFQYGNFVEILKARQTRYDAILASGVLYHLSDPLQAIIDIISSTDVIMIWSMIYDQEIENLPVNSVGRAAFTRETKVREISGDSMTYHVRSYHGVNHGAAYSGGIEAGSVWISIIDLIRVLQRHGFRTETAFHAAGELGSSACVIAQR